MNFCVLSTMLTAKICFLLLVPSLVYGCTSGSLRLYDTHGNTNETYAGSVQLCYSSAWYSVCYTGWDCRESNVACRQLGYVKAGTYIHGTSSTYGTWSNTRHYYYSCSGTESTLSTCSSHHSSSCGSTSHAAGVYCVGKLDSCSPNGCVRLTGSNKSTEGVPEYCYNGYWTPVCYYFHDEEATVFCKQLNYKPFARLLTSSEYTWTYSYTYSLLNYISCSSTASESSVASCHIYTRSNSTCARSCSSNHYVIKCYESDDCVDGSVRLQNGSIAQEGRVEVCVNGVWGIICGSGWDKNDALVVCRVLGYANSEPEISTNAKYGHGEGPIVFSYINCHGWESSLSSCSKSSYLQFTCSSSSYISGVLCTDGCIEGQLRLVGGSTTSEGTIEICHNRLWGLVTDAGWDPYDAEVVCRQLQLPTEGAVAVKGSKFGKPDRAIHYSFVLCNGDEQSLSSCNKVTHSLEEGRTIYRDAKVAGVQCLPAPPSKLYLVCSNSSVLPSDDIDECSSDDGEDVSIINGTLQYCYNGDWSVFCTLTHREAIVACRQLGYTKFTWGLVTRESVVSVSNHSLFQNISCNSTATEPNLSECTVTKGSCTCQSVVGLTCFNPVYCTEGSIRIANGSILNEGRVEVCVNGVWGSVCDDGWDKTDAYVICQQLGFSELEPLAYLGSTFGESIGPIVYSNVECGGWEKSLDECLKTNYIDLSCPQERIAGVQCLDDCLSGSIRLTGGSNKQEGNVEICVDNMWGLISEDGWSNVDAKVICKQLGYDNGTISTYDKPRRAIFISNVGCDSIESSFSNCSKILHSLNEAKQLAQISTRVAGVSCAMAASTTSNIHLPTGLPSNDDSDHALLQGIFSIVSIAAVCIIIFVIVVLVVYCKRRNKLREIQRRPLPSVGFSNLSEIRYAPLTEDTSSIEDKDEFPAHQCDDPYENNDTCNVKEPLYDLN